LPQWREFVRQRTDACGARDHGERWRIIRCALIYSEVHMNARRSSAFLAMGLVMAAAMGACTPSAESERADEDRAMVGDQLSDADVSTKVRAALRDDATVQGFNIDVVTTKGDVRLIGVLDTRAQIDHALKIAQDVIGVHAIHDELTLAP
jgi:hyperosmotically inducible protein